MKSAAKESPLPAGLHPESADRYETLGNEEIAGVRLNPVRVRRFGQGLGELAKVAFVALARKLLTVLNAIVRDQTEWKMIAAQKRLTTRLIVMHR